VLLKEERCAVTSSTCTSIRKGYIRFVSLFSVQSYLETLIS
jgi:hypothetical protein